MAPYGRRRSVEPGEVLVDVADKLVPCFVVVSGAIHVLQVTGETKRYTRIADSGNANTGVFCPNCGVRIYQIPQHVPGVLVLKPGTLDDTSWVRPSHFVYMRRAQHWIEVPAGVTALNDQFK